MEDLKTLDVLEYAMRETVDIDLDPFYVEQFQSENLYYQMSDVYGEAEALYRGIERGWGIESIEKQAAWLHELCCILYQESESIIDARLKKELRVAEWLLYHFAIEDEMPEMKTEKIWAWWSQWDSLVASKLRWN